MPSYENTIEFLVSDFPRTLFPMETNKFLIENFAGEIGDFVYGQITHKSDGHLSFLPQARAYAAKPDFHLRRTSKLDPVAEFFIYDLVYRNRRAFRKSRKKDRVNFGYRFEKAKPISATRSYRAFKAQLHEALETYKYCVKFDISSYFNSIYHHDLVNWFNDCSDSEQDTQFFDKFLKQTNSGRSIDCLPHGIYPAKMIGSHFLSFVDEASRLRSSLVLRFMDDFYFFSDDIEELIGDFIETQRMLGEKGLSVNPSKTRLGDVGHLNIEKEIDDIKLGLLQRRTKVISGSGIDEDEIDEEGEVLTPEEVDYLFSLLKDKQIEEEDAELILILMRDYGNDVLEYISDFLVRFPNLSKNIFHFCEYVEDKSQLANIVSKFLKDNQQVSEYQLFWLAKLLEAGLLNTSSAGRILNKLYEHANATDMSRAKILEIPSKNFGLSDMREEQLRTGASGWLSWSAAVGARVEKKQSRNHLLSYFANGSPMNGLIASCVKRF